MVRYGKAHPDGTQARYMKKTIQKTEAQGNFSWILSSAQVLSVGILFMILQFGLLPALLSGLLIWQLVQFAAPLFARIGITPSASRAVTLFVIAAIVITSITLGAFGLASFLNNGSEGLVALLQKMADIVDTARGHLPVWAQNYFPANVEDLQASTADWLRNHASQLSHFGKGIGVTLVYILTGMVIGGMVAFSKPGIKEGPLTECLKDRVTMLGKVFRRIVFSQVRISAINTTLTAIFLVGILPLCGIHLPFTKIMITVTFIAGLLPVIGNLISNTVIVLVSLGISPGAAIGSLTFLVLVHKLEYFLNAHIIGTNIRARAWELLVAMLFMEAVFGVKGLICAPIYYAYVKDELASRKLL